MPPRVRSLAQTTSRGWCLTINNYTEAHVAAFDAYECEYKIRGFEIAASGTPHLQAYIFKKKKASGAQLKRLLPTAHLELAKGTPQQNRTYCSKDGDFKEFGEIPVKGKRTDLTTFVNESKSSSSKFSESTLLEEYASLVARYPQFVDRVQSHYHPPTKLKKLDNHWFHGPPGTGKTVRATLHNPSYFVKAANKWWDGYAGQHTVILEDISPEQGKFLLYFIKIWADFAPFLGQVKCSTMFIRPQSIIVTSNYSIQQMGWDDVSATAVGRRFTQKFYGEPYDYAKEMRLLAVENHDEKEMKESKDSDSELNEPASQVDFEEVNDSDLSSDPRVRSSWIDRNSPDSNMYPQSDFDLDPPDGPMYFP